MYDPYFEGVMVMALAAAYLAIMVGEGNRRMYLLYFIAGSLIGFYFDSISISQGFYSYTPYGFTLLGMPVLITLGEGFAVAITVYVFEWLKGRFAGSGRGRGR
jgi:hypothetical protein